MTTVIVNGHQCETGCYLEGAYGWHNHVRMLRVAQGLGWEIDDELSVIIDRYDDGNEADDDVDIIVDAMDEAERWLNDHTAVMCATCGYNAGTAALFIGHTPDHPVEPQRFIWHWHDGEFFLSPICENGDCDDDTCAHWE